MERLTRKLQNKKSWRCVGDYISDYPRNVVNNRLAAYEDILFNPDGTERVTMERLREIVEANVEKRILPHVIDKSDEIFFDDGMDDEIHPCLRCETGWTRVDSDGSCLGCITRCEKFADFLQKYASTRPVIFCLKENAAKEGNGHEDS